MSMLQFNSLQFNYIAPIFNTNITLVSTIIVYRYLICRKYLNLHTLKTEKVANDMFKSNPVYFSMCFIYTSSFQLIL